MEERDSIKIFLVRQEKTQEPVSEKEGEQGDTRALVPKDF